VVIRFYVFETLAVEVIVLSVLTPCVLVLELAGLVYCKVKSGLPYKVCNCVLRRTEIRIS